LPAVDAKQYRDRMLRCPFCLTVIRRIWDIESPYGVTHEGGKCPCGAVFFKDRTGKNLGELYSDTLVFAYDWDFDAAYSVEDTEYEEAVVRQVTTSGKFLLGEGARSDRSPKFYFLRRLDSVQALKEDKEAEDIKEAKK